LFVNVAVKVEWFNANIGATKRAFQESPKVLDTLSVNLAVNIFNRVIDDGSFKVDSLIASKLIGD
jgi:hypothetical protein